MVVDDHEDRAVGRLNHIADSPLQVDPLFQATRRIKHEHGITAVTAGRPPELAALSDERRAHQARSATTRRVSSSACIAAKSSIEQSRSATTPTTWPPWTTGRCR
jgi:hypothetical protein